VLSKQDNGGSASCMRSWIVIPASAARRLFQPVRSRGAIAERTEIAAIWHRVREGRYLLQRVGGQPRRNVVHRQSLDRELSRGACEYSPSRFKT
jgi:hypothetical protein